MSQIDLLNFLPHLIWFVSLGLVFYFLIFSFILPMIFESLKLRRLFFNFLFDSFFFSNRFLIYFDFI